MLYFKPSNLFLSFKTVVATLSISLQILESAFHIPKNFKRLDFDCIKPIDSFGDNWHLTSAAFFNL